MARSANMVDGAMWATLALTLTLAIMPPRKYNATQAAESTPSQGIQMPISSPAAPAVIHA